MKEHFQYKIQNKFAKIAECLKVLEMPCQEILNRMTSVINNASKILGLFSITRPHGFSRSDSKVPISRHKTRSLVNDSRRQYPVHDIISSASIRHKICSLENEGRRQYPTHDIIIGLSMQHRRR